MNVKVSIIMATQVRFIFSKNQLSELKLEVDYFTNSIARDFDVKSTIITENEKTIEVDVTLKDSEALVDMFKRIGSFFYYMKFILD